MIVFFTSKGGIISVTRGVGQTAAKQTLAATAEEAVSSGSAIPLGPPPAYVLSSTRGGNNTDQIAPSAPISGKLEIVVAKQTSASDSHTSTPGNIKSGRNSMT